MFPVSDASQTIIDCLLHAAKAAKVRLWLNSGVERATKHAEGGFELTLSKSGTRRNSPLPAYGGRDNGIAQEQGAANPGPEPLHFGMGEGESGGEKFTCDRLLLATGGCRAAAAGQLAVSLGHTLEPPVPSLFTFHIETPWLRDLAGVSVGPVKATVPGTGLRERGAVLVTHWGLSGPVILRLSAWGARQLHSYDYRFTLRLNWLPLLSTEALDAELDLRRKAQPARLVVNAPIAPLSARLWERLVTAAGILRDIRWADLSRSAQHQLVQQLIRTELPVTGKSVNKDEFVTCGGVR